MRRTAIAAAALLAAGQAAAQDGAAPAGWDFTATFYGWLPGISSTVDTNYGALDSSMSGSDALSDLQFAFMGALEARHGRWGVIGDLIYTDLSTSEPTPFGRLFRKATLDTKLTAFTGYAAYRLHEDPKVAFDVLGGFRLFSVDLDVRLAGATARSRSWSDSDTWVVPVIGARAILPINDKWSFTALADAGGSGDDTRTWQALATVRYAFDERWTAVAGYRYMDIEKPVGGNDTEIELYGPAIGVSYHF